MASGRVACSDRFVPGGTRRFSNLPPHLLQSFAELGIIKAHDLSHVVGMQIHRGHRTGLNSVQECEGVSGPSGQGTYRVTLFLRIQLRIQLQDQTRRLWVVQVRQGPNGGVTECRFGDRGLECAGGLFVLSADQDVQCLLA